MRRWGWAGNTSISLLDSIHIPTDYKAPYPRMIDGPIWRCIVRRTILGCSQSECLRVMLVRTHNAQKRWRDRRIL